MDYADSKYICLKNIPSLCVYYDLYGLIQFRQKIGAEHARPNDMSLIIES